MPGGIFATTYARPNLIFHAICLTDRCLDSSEDPRRVIDNELMKRAKCIAGIWPTQFRQERIVLQKVLVLGRLRRDTGIVTILTQNTKL